MPHLALAPVPGHVDTQAYDALERNVLEVTLPAVIDNLVSPRPDAVEVADPGRTEVVFTGSFEEVNRLYYENGWSDGLPIVPPTEEDVREFLSVSLVQYGAEVSAFATAAEALRALEELRPHVLISDIGMPGEDGYEFIRRVRALGPERGGQTPAAALTAHAKGEDGARVLTAGFQMHLAKPVPPAELAGAVATLAGRQTVPA